MLFVPLRIWIRNQETCYRSPTHFYPVTTTTRNLKEMLHALLGMTKQLNPISEFLAITPCVWVITDLPLAFIESELSRRQESDKKNWLRTRGKERKKEKEETSFFFYTIGARIAWLGVPMRWDSINSVYRPPQPSDPCYCPAINTLSLRGSLLICASTKDVKLIVQ